MHSSLDDLACFPGPRQQIVEPTCRMSVDHAREHVAQIDVRLDDVQLAGFDQRADHRPALATSIAAGKEVVLAPECNRPVILPISGRRSRSITAGTHSMGAAFAASMSSGAPAAMSFMSR